MMMQGKSYFGTNMFQPKHHTDACIPPRFIFLPECEHCIEVEGMDHWMATNVGGQIQPKCCPRCKTTVRICMRYGDIIKSTFDDIAKAKKKILQLKGNPLEFFKRANTQVRKCISLIKKCQPLNSLIVAIVNQNLKDIYQLLKPKTKNGKKVNPSMGSDIRFQTEVNLSFLERVLEMMAKMILEVENPHGSNRSLMSTLAPTSTKSTYMAPELTDELNALVQKLLYSLLKRSRISIAEYRTVDRELERLEYVQAYFVLKSSALFPTIGATSSENQLIQQLLMNNVRVLEDSQKVEIKSALKKLGENMKTGLGISDKERQEIVTAMGMSRGHWFKCPNGHIYAIGDCGGATMESRCNECNAVIGGGNHQVRNDNGLAREMDGAIAPAWPMRV